MRLKIKSKGLSKFEQKLVYYSTGWVVCPLTYLVMRFLHGSAVVSQVSFFDLYREMLSGAR